MDKFTNRIHHAANLLTNGVCRLKVADLLQEDGADLAEAILTTITAEQHLKELESENNS